MITIIFIYLYAGYGSALNLDGAVEMDASIMNGSNLQLGSVTVVKDIKHPIRFCFQIVTMRCISFISNTSFITACFWFYYYVLNSH